MNIHTRRPKRWSTHMPMLIKAVLISEGDVVEVGGGLFSTPLLHWLCHSLGRKLITYENDPKFCQFAQEFADAGHEVIVIENWDDMDFKTHRGVVLIDHHPEPRRAVDILNFKDSADYIVIHDTERPDKYDYDRVWKHFRYVHHWKDEKPWTSVVSNLKDLSNL